MVWTGTPRQARLLLSLLPLCRCSHEDALALIQSSVEVRESPLWAGRPVLLAPSSRQAFPPLPPLDGVAAQVAGTVADVTKQVGEVSGHVEDWASKGIDWAQHSGLKATEQIVNTFDELLGTVEVAANELLQRAMAERERLQQALASAGINHDTGLPPTDVLTRRLLQKFAQTVNSFIDVSVGNYGMFSQAVRAGGAAFTRGLQNAGQKPLSDRLNTTLSNSVIWLDSFKAEMLSLEGKLATAGIKVQSGLGGFLQSMSRGACSTSEAVSRFADLFQQGFQNMCDQLTDAIASRLLADETAKIYEAMSAVQHSVGNIIWKLQSAKRELVLGVNQGIADVARTLRIEPSPVVACTQPLPAALPDVDSSEDTARFFVRPSAAKRAGQGLTCAVGLLLFGLDLLHL